MGIQYHFIMRLKLPTPPNNSAKKFKVIGAGLIILGVFSIGAGAEVCALILSLGGIFWVVGRIKE